MPRLFFLALGWVCVIFGFAGIVLPLLPTTPFLLLALWAFTRCSPALGHWLRNHQTFGAYIRDWDEHRIVPVKAKIAAITMMSASFCWLVFGTNAPWYVAIVTGVILLCVATWLITRPSERSR
jgi:uncharacterized membrane protein YbaN (DUF454 family)